MSFKLFLFVALVLFSCKKGNKDSSSLVIGHGGMGVQFSGSIFHDNSKEAFDLALSLNGCDGIEIDVRLSKDGDLWAYHDNDLKQETDLDGCIEESTFEQLNGTKYKGFGGEKLIRLIDLKLTTNNKIILLDIHADNACSGGVSNMQSYIAALNNLPSELKDPSRVRMIVSNQDWIPHFLNEGYSVLFNSPVTEEIDAIFNSFPATSGAVIQNDKIEKPQVDNYLQAGKSVYIFAVRSPKALKEVSVKNPTGVMSDDVQGAILQFK
jgi:glycerophosphoryl diester phosphodiesterase